MPLSRKLLLTFTILIVGGSTGWTTWQGVRLRTDWYHRNVVADLTEFFEMPCEVGRIEPRTFSSRVFNDIAVRLPQRIDAAPVFSCGQAVWTKRTSEGVPANELELHKGLINLGAEGWQLSDYSQVLQSGLGHDFNDLNLAKVTLADFELAFRKGLFAIRCRDATGEITFPSPREGLAYLTAYEFNGYRVSEGVRIHARFEPKKGVRMHEVFLDLPAMPLNQIGITMAGGGELTAGRFAGRVEYQNDDGTGESAVKLRGELSNANLAEISSGFSLGPLAGRISINVSEARVSKSLLTHLRGRGRIDGLTLESLARMLNREHLAGEAHLNVLWADFALGHINELSVSGLLQNVSLAEMLAPLGEGTATGSLAMRVNSFRIADDRIAAADIEITALPPPGTVGTIDRSLLIGAAQKAAGFEWPGWLPEALVPDKIEYVECGVRLLVRDNKLRILGTHGDGGRTIITLKIMGRTFGLVKERPGVIDLTPWIEEGLARDRAYDPTRMRDWLERHRSSQPAGTGD